ncbi:KNOTEN1 [Hibiscus trionum]|uniref:KNOTEN1 n=1 Tax=Hibiscus trionum TaxID=183268 RepID=A0A9W7IRU9_HIBTR|nr:KNOTEN1 [Hibiscus trionum]
MANFEAPSFSLGLDLDLDADSEPRLPADDQPGLILDPNPSASFNTLVDDAEDLESQQVMDSDPDTRLDPPRVLKRLRRAADESSATKKESEKTVPWNNEDEEIEEFSSSRETNDVDSSTKYHSVCSSSKVPLKRFRLLTSQSSSRSSSKKKEEELVAPVSANLKVRRDGLSFPKLTISPLRRFQLLDSDSDDPSDHEDTGKRAHKIVSLSKEQKSVASDEKIKTPFSKPQNEDLWKDFSIMNSSCIQTPAFDEICKEYFQSLNDKNASQKLGNNKSVSQKLESQKVERLQDLDGPPAHCYFFHADQRIQKLVCSRLPFFTPLSMVNSGQHQQPNVSVMDFTSQFSKGESSKQRGSQKASGKDGSTSRRNKSKKPNAENGAFEGWVNPKSSGAIPKNAGKRRVHASGGQSAGHWYTSPEGRKVYVSRTGQELSGQMAYRHYRKESGGGFRKSKKKSNAKKKRG